jgi:hypothetical protein
MIKNFKQFNENKSVSKNHLKQILNLTNNTSLDKKLLTDWISRTGEMVILSDKEYDLFKMIKSGGIDPKKFSPKN